MQLIQQQRQEADIVCTTVMPTRPVPDMIDDVRESLLARPRRLSPKYFYDERGSALFDRICTTPEYYPTRIENRLLKKCAADVIDKTRPSQILELGSGYSVKTRRLFDACEANLHVCEYAPFDVCEEVLLDSSSKLSEEYEWLNLRPLLGDYHAGLGNLPDIPGRRLFVFLGSTIGNFEKQEAIDFISEINRVMRHGDFLLLGVDRVKESKVLNAAYNDDQGITAEFNLNVLRVLNRELDANFRLDNFSHSARFNTDESRIEMRLVSDARQQVYIHDLQETIEFSEGEDILTEISQKYTFNDIEQLLCRAGLGINEHFEDEQAYFSLVLAGKTD